eukprot:CAMPEP_0177647130 /NCGR_PEP_ID=MMETSP0447-20121125/10139_1 /TAXON_ID=0 /ORGANISM="Stygamoeba regulata, Strain BSH-02190019" /LENGTH=927 /DNA_ID=CAMNT_0019149701 /DNA_START=320 /DNA_END=3103 /DNA_ORIENTATION=+
MGNQVGVPLASPTLDELLGTRQTDVSSSSSVAAEELTPPTAKPSTEEVCWRSTVHVWSLRAAESAAEHATDPVPLWKLRKTANRSVAEAEVAESAAIDAEGLSARCCYVALHVRRVPPIPRGHSPSRTLLTPGSTAAALGPTASPPSYCRSAAVMARSVFTPRGLASPLLTVSACSPVQVPPGFRVFPLSSSSSSASSSSASSSSSSAHKSNGHKSTTVSSSNSDEHTNGSACVEKANLAAAPSSARCKSVTLAYDLYVWNGAEASGLLRAAALARGYQLDRRLSDAENSPLSSLFFACEPLEHAQPASLEQSASGVKSALAVGSNHLFEQFQPSASSELRSGALRARVQFGGLFASASGAAQSRSDSWDSDSCSSDSDDSDSESEEPSDDDGTENAPQKRSPRPSSKGSNKSGRRSHSSKRRHRSSSKGGGNSRRSHRGHSSGDKSASRKHRGTRSRRHKHKDQDQESKRKDLASQRSKSVPAVKKLALPGMRRISTSNNKLALNALPLDKMNSSKRGDDGCEADDCTPSSGLDGDALDSTRSRLKYFDPLCSQIAERLYLGSDTVARNGPLLRENKITHVLNCAGVVCDNYFPEEFSYKMLFLMDGKTENVRAILPAVLEWMADAFEASPENRIYVHCQQGVSRSSTMVIAYLMWKLQKGYSEVSDLVKQGRNVSSPNAGFMAQLMNWWRHVSTPLAERSPTLFRITPHRAEDPHTFAMRECTLDLRLDPRFPFVLASAQCQYVWSAPGVHSQLLAEAHRSVVRLHRFEGFPEECHTLTQGDEPPLFLELLRAAALASRDKPNAAVAGQVCQVPIYNEEAELIPLIDQPPPTIKKLQFVIPNDVDTDSQPQESASAPSEADSSPAAVTDENVVVEEDGEEHADAADADDSRPRSARPSSPPKNNSSSSSGEKKVRRTRSSRRNKK